MEECSLLASSLGLAQLLFNTAQAHLHRDGDAHSELGLPTDAAQANPGEALSQLRFALPRYIKWTAASNSNQILFNVDS